MSADCVKKKSEMIERWIWRKIDVFGIIFGFTIAISTLIYILAG